MTLLSLAAVSAIAACSARAAQRLDLDLASHEWQTSSRGAFSVRLDRRGVLTMSHADSPAHNGERAAVSRVIDLPADLRGPLVLRFYLTDDYCGDKQQAAYFRDAVKERISDWKEEVRFCEVVLDDVVVWSKDVIGRNGTTAGERFYDLEISDLVKGKRDVQLAFRVRDQADTGDEPFPTDVFWARPELLWAYGGAPPPVAFPPRLAFRREKFNPPPPPPASGSLTLTVRNPSGTALDAWPIRWGMPLPPGAITDATQVALQGPAGQPVPLQTQVTSRWPDGSVKWLRLDFIAPLPLGDTPYRLQYSSTVGAASAAMPSADVGAASAATPSRFSALAVTDRGEVTLHAVSQGDPTAPLVGPVCQEARLHASYRADDGWQPMVADLAVRSYAGLPFLFVRHTLQVSGAKGGVRLRELALDLPSAPWPGRSVGIDGRSVNSPGASFELRQLDDQKLTIGSREGAPAEPQAGRWDGWALSDDGRAAVALRWPWQQFPNGLRSQPDGERLLLLSVAPGASPLTLAPGEAKSHELLIYSGPDALDARQAAALNAVFQRPPVVVLPPGWVAATGALGHFQEQDPRRFPEYEAPAAKLAQTVLAQRERQRAYGFENFGDLQFGWGFGEALTYWQNSEYDYAHCLLWQFLRTGDPELFYTGEQAALHYRDVDLIHADDEHPAWVGGAHHHSETHTGHPPSISHHWTEGLFDHWLLTGDSRSLDCARQAAGYAERVALAHGYGGGERDAGWNLIALMGAYRATGNDAMLEAARKKVGGVLAYLDPMRGVSSAPIYEQTAYEGGTPFMAAILMRGLTAYYDETKDERVGWAICGLCDWLACEMMPSPGRFYYKQTPQLHSLGSQLLAVDGTAFAWNFTGDPVYRQLALDVYRQGVGSASLTNMRDMPHALALLASALPPIALAALERPLLIASQANVPPTATFLLRNLSGKPEQAVISLAPAVVGAASAAMNPAEVPDSPGPVKVSVPLPIVAGKPGVQRFQYTVACRDEPTAEGEIASLVVPRLPRIVLLADQANLTARSLDLLAIPYQRVEMERFSSDLLPNADLLVCGFDVGRKPLEPHAQALAAWVRDGGVLLGFRDSSAANAWLPSPLKQDASYQPGPILEPDAAPFALLHQIAPDALSAVHGGSMYAAFYDLGEGWQPLASAGAKQAWDQAEPKSTGPHYGLVELRLGKGRIILSQLIPEYAWLNDDAASPDSAGRLLLENLLAYACLLASP